MNLDSNNPPEPSEDQDKPKRRRYRIPRSCDRCRASKIRCTVENDRCNACAYAGVPCTFAHPGSLKERPPTFKDVECLSARIRALERLLQAVDPSVDLNNLPDPNQLMRIYSSSNPEQAMIELMSQQPTLVPAPHLASSTTSLSGFGKDESRSSYRPTLAVTRWNQLDKTKPTDNFDGIALEPNYYIGPNALFSGSEPEALCIPRQVPYDSNLVYPVDEYIRGRCAEYASRFKHFYPEPDLEQDLIKLYFQHFHPFLSILHPPTFYALHTSGLAHSDPSFRALCLFMFAIASRWSNDPRVQLDLDGKPHPSRQVAGLRFGFAAYVNYCFPITCPTTLYDLQSLVLLSIASLGFVHPTITWARSGMSLQRAQECGAHREVHNYWNADPLRDYLRRKAFFALYHLNHAMSATLNRTPTMLEEQFDVQPFEAHATAALGIYVNPYSSISKATLDVFLAHDQGFLSLSEIGGIRSMLPLLNMMQVKAQVLEGTQSAKSLEALVNRVDRDAAKWFDQLPPILKHSNVNGCPDQLMCSVGIITFYQEFQLLIHQSLFNHQVTRNESSSDLVENPHTNKCVEFGSSLIHEINKLRVRNMLTGGFFWIPSRISQAAILVICSIRKQRKSINQQQYQARCEAVTTAIKILEELALSTYIAELYATALQTLLSLVDAENPPVLEVLNSTLRSKVASHNMSRYPPFNPTTTTTDPATLVNIQTSSASQSHLESEMAPGEAVPRADHFNAYPALVAGRLNEYQDGAYDYQNIELNQLGCSWDPLKIATATLDIADTNLNQFHSLFPANPSLP